MEKKKILVIGSNSFSGAHFVSGVLSRGASVIGVSRSVEPDPVFLPYKWNGSDGSTQFRFYQYDLNCDLNKIIDLAVSFRPDYIVNFAAQSMVAQSWENPGHWFQTNALSTIEFHNKIRAFSFLEKYVHISTPEVYGSCEGKVKENTDYNPSTPYAVSRAAADMSLMTFFNAYDFPVIFTRAANVYGPGQQLYRIIPRAILFFKIGRTLSLHGGGVSERSFIHISDVVDGTIKAMLNGQPGEIYHFSTRQLISIRALTQKIATALNVDFDEVVNVSTERLGKDFAYILDSRKAETALQWEPKINLDKGIEETVDWVSSNLAILKKLPYDYQHKP